MAGHPERCCPRCGGTALIKSGHARGKQRWRCKGCGLQFTRTTPRGMPAAIKREAVELYCTGLSMNAIAKRFGVAAQSVLRWVRDHADEHCPRPEPDGATACVVELDEMWHFVQKRPTNSGSGRRSRGMAG
jgi:transposase-like protein